MLDTEDQNLTFEQANSGASYTFPQQAGTIRKGGFIVIKGRPCKVVEVSTSKTGKHGHAKCNFTALDIFTNKKLEDMQPASHNCEAPVIKTLNYSLLDIDEEGFVSLMDDAGDTREDLKLPSGHDDADNLAKQIQEMFDAGKDLQVTVLTAMGESQLNTVKEVQT